MHEFWGKTTSIISDLIGHQIPVDPIILLLNDDSKLNLFEKQRKIWLAGLTATKKMIAQRWLPPHSLSIHQWLAYFHDIVMLELSAARINKAKSTTLSLWRDAASQISTIMTSVPQETVLQE